MTKKFLSDVQLTTASINAINAAANPVGTIREFNVSTNPATLLGFGTWAAFGTGRVTVAIDPSQVEFDTNGETGGAKTHTLATTEIPSHTHVAGHVNTAVTTASTGGVYNMLDPNQYGHNCNSTATGGGQAHNNLQPYIVVYRWVRTA